MESTILNATKTDCADVTPEPGTIVAIQVVLGVILETIGNALLFALILFEKYGMDPQKRSLTNQLFSLQCGALIVMNILDVPLMLASKVIMEIRK